MDGLIVLFVIIAIVNAVGSANKKKRREAEQMRAQSAASEVKAPIRDVRPRPAPAPIPRKAAQVSVHAAEPQVSVARQEGFGEGSVSTQGESAEEHAEHRRRIAAEEAARHQAREALRDLRVVRRDSLRAAIVMSEVLNKPVALRPRAGLHR